MLVLMLLKSKGKGVRFEVSGRVPVFIGRHALGLDAIDSKMSRQHAEIWFERGAWLLRDLHSTNGTYVNGKRASGLVELEVGDRIRCGRTDLVISDLQPLAPHDDGSWGSDPDDTAMAAGELSGLLDAAQREGATPGVVRLGSANFDEHEPEDAPAGEESFDEAQASNQDPDADLISLLDTETQPQAPRKTPKAHSKPSATDQPPHFDEALGATELPARSPEPDAAHSSHADEYTGDAVIDLPTVTPTPPEASELQDSPPQAETPDNSFAAEVASVPTAASDTPKSPDILETPAAAEPPSAAPISESPTPIDAPAASADSDGSEPNEAPRADEPVASDSPSHAPSDQDDDDMLTLGFRGSEEPSREIEVDDPGLRGETPAPPGRFTVQDDDALENTNSLECQPADTKEPKDPQKPWAQGERAALLGPPIDHDLDQGRPATGTRYPGHAGGRGRQKLPMAVVGTLVMVFAGSAWVLAALQQGWISPPSVTGSGSGAETDATPDTSADISNDLLGTDLLADARRPRSNSPTRIYAESRSRNAARSGNTTAATPQTQAQPQAAVASTITTQANRNTNEFNAFDNALPLPNAPAAAPTQSASNDAVLASATAPRVGNAEQLQAIIDRADANGTATTTDPTTATEEPARPRAVDNPSESFVWSGITIGNDNTVFKADTQPSNTQATAIEPTASSPASPGIRGSQGNVTPPSTQPQPTVVAVAAPNFNLDRRPAVPQTPVNPAVLNAPRRVAFLVDISGTMVDSMPQLRAHLADAIDRLEPDTAFTVLLFRQNQAIELPPTGLRIASASARSQAIRWLNDDLSQGAGAVQLGGRSDPTRALNTALDYAVSDLVVLSDNALGKRAKPNGGDLGVLDLMDALEDHPDIKLHAVQFNYADERQLLRQLTDRFDGDYQFVEEVLDASPDGLEPLTLIDALR
ncbi:MAG: FHA domain-containing protein [Planctomycetota bacterium]